MTTMGATVSRWELYKRSLLSLWSQFKRKKSGMFGLFMLMFFIGIAFFAPIIVSIWGYDPKDTVGPSFLPPFVKNIRIESCIGKPEMTIPTVPDGPIVAERFKVSDKLGKDFIYVKSIGFFLGSRRDWKGELTIYIWEDDGSPYHFPDLNKVVVKKTILVELDDSNPTWVEAEFSNLKLGVDKIFHIGIGMLDPNVHIIYVTWEMAINESVTNREWFGGDAFCYEYFDEKSGSWYVKEEPMMFSTFDLTMRLHIEMTKTFILGTDDAGRDVFSQMIYGTQVSLLIGFLATLMTVVIGTFIGIVSGYMGGKIDDILMRITDIMLVIPGLPLMIVLAAILGPSITTIILVIGILSWPTTARFIRAQVLTLKERAFVEAARAAGATDFYIMRKHILPNVMPLVFAEAILMIASAILIEAALSFLGLGDPVHISWGMILHYAEMRGAFSRGAWWCVVPPGLAITLVCVSFVFIGNALDEILNPRLRRR